MKKWNVWVPYYANVLVKGIEAETEEEAEELAAAEAEVVLCHQCVRHVEMGEPNTSIEVDAVEVK